MKLSEIWDWLTTEVNRNTLTYLVSGLAAVATAAWATFKALRSYWAKPKNKGPEDNLPATSAPTALSIGGVAAAGNIHVAGNMTVGISSSEYIASLERVRSSVLEDLKSAEGAKRRELEAKASFLSEKIELQEKSIAQYERRIQAANAFIRSYGDKYWTIRKRLEAGDLELADNLISEIVADAERFLSMRFHDPSGQAYRKQAELAHVIRDAHLLLSGLAEEKGDFRSALSHLNSVSQYKKNFFGKSVPDPPEPVASSRAFIGNQSVEFALYFVEAANPTTEKNALRDAILRIVEQASDTQFMSVRDRLIRLTRGLRNEKMLDEAVQVLKRAIALEDDESKREQWLGGLLRDTLSEIERREGTS